MKPIIGITANKTLLNNDQYHPFLINYSPVGFSEAIIQAGGIPLIIPISDPEVAERYLTLVDGLLLTGGQDVSPQLYNEEPRHVMGETSPERDASELALIKSAIALKKPMLGVCRGMQLLNVALGGSLYQDLHTDADIAIQHVQKSQPDCPTHSIKIEPESHLASLITYDNHVNSIHHQAVKQLGEGFSATAWSLDGIIEAIERIDEQMSIIGVQWHPELSFTKQPESLALFTDLINRATK